MSAVSPQNAMSQVNQNMLSKLNINTNQTQALSKAPAAPALKADAQSAQKAPEDNGDTLTIAGKTIKKKTALIGAAAILGSVLALAVLIKKGIDKGKIQIPDFFKRKRPDNAPKDPLKGKGPKPAPDKAPKDAPKPAPKKPNKPAKPAETGKPKNNTPKKTPKQQAKEPQAARIEAPKKSPEELRAEIEAEVQRRAEAEHKRAERAKIAQDYFFDLNDSSCGKSAKESAVIIQRAAKLNESGLSGLNDETKQALSSEFRDYLASSAPSTRGQMKRISRNAAKMQAEFTPDEIKKLTNSKFYMKSLLGEYLKGIEDPKGRAEIVEFLHEAARLIP